MQSRSQYFYIFIATTIINANISGAEKDDLFGGGGEHCRHILFSRSPLM